MTSQEHFKNKNFVQIGEAINGQTAELLYYYTKLETRKLIFLEEQKESIRKQYGCSDNTNALEKQYGEFTDTQCPGTFSKYGDLTFDTLLLLLLPKMEEATGMKLIPTYSYHRLYKHGDYLKAHRDRKSCDISATMCLGYDLSNLNEKEQQEYNWCMYVKDNEGLITKSFLKPGDMFIYRGELLEHWRDNFIGVNHSQVFLHYNKAEDTENLYDGRPELGLPGIFMRNNNA